MKTTIVVKNDTKNVTFIFNSERVVFTGVSFQLTLKPQTTEEALSILSATQQLNFWFDRYSVRCSFNKKEQSEQIESVLLVLDKEIIKNIIVE